MYEAIEFLIHKYVVYSLKSHHDKEARPLCVYRGGQS